MGRLKKYYTEEEKLAAKRLAGNKYYLANKKKVDDISKEWKEKNKTKVSAYHKQKNFLRIISEEEKQNKIKYLQKYRQDKKIVLNTYRNFYRKERKKVDYLYKIKETIRTLVSKSIKPYKKITTVEILGCTYSEFKIHLESLFQPWMNWSNYGKYNGELDYGWDIDHIIPISSAITEEDVIRLNHYCNLQPLCGKTNRDIKRNKIDF